MKQKHYNYPILLILLFSFLSSKLSSQVTIGCELSPIEGALLDLKEKATDGSESSSKGLILPRVKLSNLKPANAQELAQSIGNTTDSYDMDAHAGLLVYNAIPVTFNKEKCKWDGQAIGVYLWTGSEWVLMNNKEEINNNPDVREVPYGANNQSFIISYTDPNTNDTEITSYHYSTFGSAGTWMTENLATKYMPDGTVLNKLLEPSSSPRYYTPNGLNDNDPLINSSNKYGLLYNWTAAMGGNNCPTLEQGQVNGSTPGSNEVEVYNGGYIQGICPKGWHLPSDREWNELEKEITSNMNLYTDPIMEALSWNSNWEYGTSGFPGYGFRGATINGHGKAIKSPMAITSKLTSGYSKRSINGGFDALLVGNALSSINNYGDYGYFWSSSSGSNSGSTQTAYNRYVGYLNTQVARLNISREYFFSIRCKKDK